MTYKRASFTLMGWLTGLLCFFAILLSTPWGAQLSFYFVSSVSAVEAQYKSGSILNDLVLRTLTIESDHAVINAKNIHLKLHLRCLWKNQLCIDELSIAKLQVNLKENGPVSTDEFVEQALESSNFTLPFTIKLKKFYLSKAQLKNQELTVNLADFSSALSVKNIDTKNIEIYIKNASLAKVHVNLYKTIAASSKSTDISPWPLTDMPKLYSPFKLAINSMVVKTIIVDEIDNKGNENTLLTTTDSKARLSWFKTQLFIEELSSTVAEVGAFSLKGKLDFVLPYLVDLKLNSEIKNFERLPQLNNSNQKVLLSGNFSDLSSTISSEGELALTAELSINITDKNLPYKLKVDATQFILPDNIANVINPSTLLLKSQGDVNQHVIDLNSIISGFGYQDASLELSATYDEQILKINTLHFEELKSNNELSMKGELQLGEQLLWDIAVHSSGITLPKIEEKLSGRLKGNITSKGFFNNDEWAFTLVNSTVTGAINNISLSAEANIDIDHKGGLTPSNFTLDYGDIAFKFKGYSDENWHIDGTIDIGNTSLWLKNIESDLRSSISIVGPVRQPELSFKGQLKNFLMDGFSSEKVSFDVKYKPLNNHEHQISFTSERVNWNDYFVNSVNLASSGDLNQQKLNVTWLGDSSVDLVINSHYSPQNNLWKGKTNEVTFSLGEYAFKSNQPLQIVFDNAKSTIAIDKHCWLGNGSEFCLNKDAALKTTNGDLILAIKLGADFLSPFIPENTFLKSPLAGNVAIAWQNGNMPSVNAQLLMSDGHLQIKKEENLHQLLEWQKGKLNFQLNYRRVAGNMTLFTVDNTEMLNASTSILFAENSIIESKFTINDFNLSPLQVFVPEISSLEGTLNTKFSMVGALDKPVIKGGIIVTKGKVKVLGNIDKLDDINLALDFKGLQANISGGLNINNVTASIKGDVDWQDELQGKFTFDGEEIKFSIPPDITLTVSPHLNAQIKASELKVYGRIEVLEGKLSVNKLPLGSVSLSNDVIIVNDEGEQVTNEKPFELYTNIRVVIADAFKVEGQGFVGRLGGELQISQQPHQPFQLFGSLKVPEGRYRAYGQDLSMTKGIISFNGTANNPYVSMQATRNIEKEKVIVGIDATGLANSLNIKLFSQPTMQQSEMLSYLVRGKGLDVETSDSNTAIGMALGSAITNYSGVLTQIEKLPLINRIEVDGDDKQASIAGYLGEQVYIKYGVGIVEPINELTVRFYLLNQLWVEVVSGLENSADIYYSFDIK
jgi:translocation and assembly module TamB